MIIGGGLRAPDEKTTLLSLSAKELLQDYGRRTVHLREDGGGLVVAEGEEELFTLPGTSTGIAALPGKLFAHDPARKRLYAMKADLSGYEYFYGSTYEPYRIFRFFGTEGQAMYYGVTQQGVLSYGASASSTANVASGKGGCAAVFRERIFTARGVRVHYCKPFDPSEWREARYGGGYLDLPADGLGDVLGMQPYKDKLYLFRKHGITSLRVLGDEINFKAVHMPMKCGALFENTVARCGENVGYFTDAGLFLFNGAVSVPAKNARFGEIDFTKSAKAVSHCGKYFALVAKKAGGTAVYCYDPVWEEAHFIENGAVDIASGDELCFTRGQKAYRVTEKGVSQGVTPCLTAKRIAFGLGAEKLLRTVAIDGEGTFSVTVASDRGARTVRGSANRALKLRSPLRGGSFDIKIGVEADAAGARFRAVLFRFTEEDE